jgi:hypothetical protein
MSQKQLQATIAFSSVEVLTAVEAPATKTDAERTIRQSGFGTDVALKGSSLPAVTQPASVQTLTMTGSAVTIDLTNLAGLAIPPTATRALNLTAAKIIGFHIKPRSANAGPVTVAPGGSNPYPLFGTGNHIVLQPGQEIGCVFNGIASTLPAVGPTVKNIDITGTAADLVDILIFA